MWTQLLPAKASHMSTSTKFAGKALAFGICMVIATIAITSVSYAQVTPPVFLTRLYNTILTYPSSAGLIVGGHFVEGGGRTATSTSGAVVPLGFSNFDEENLIDVTLNVSSATLSLPASSTIKKLPSSATTNSAFCASSADAGRSRTIVVRNATTTAGINLTIAGGTGVYLKKHASSSQPIIYGDTDGLNNGRITLTCLSTTDLVADLITFTD